MIRSTSLGLQRNISSATMAAPVEQITLYTAKAEIALAEAGVDFTRFEIDLANKPEWYAPQVNPASKVPAVAYGGPPVPASQPSPASAKIAESLVILEFFADLFPQTTTLLPTSPVLRAKARLFIDAISNKFVPSFYKFQALGDSSPQNIASMFEAVEITQRLLADPEKEKEGGGEYALGKEFSNADAAIAPFLVRWEIGLSEDIGAYEEGEGKKVWDLLSKEAKYERFRRYLRVLKERESVKKTYDADYIRDFYGKRFAEARAKRKAQAASA
ncbi:hypothetical protein D9758_013280 [Tetrapyrgos nigripes]|uniref:Glutathione S-transferase n=1 Tax=Tetrapyrgos nigripes TaxID=182062 RepID=A0A8H5FP25_9AGAR|nr:hypothetical protein D9758_013280 [Tetrapyrgos nigripes]